MLFVSRLVFIGKYGIMDTDDGSEEILTFPEIHEAVKLLDSGIKGVNASRIGACDVWIDNIHPYQDPEKMTQLQLKYKVVHGIDVVTCGSTVTNIRFNADRLTNGAVAVRLSDFGVACSDFIFGGNWAAGRHTITVVLDDKVNITTHTFGLYANKDAYSVGLRGLGVVVDIREVTSDDVAERVYRSMYSGNSLELRRSVIDNTERKERILEITNLG